MLLSPGPWDLEAQPTLSGPARLQGPWSRLWTPPWPLPEGRHVPLFAMKKGRVLPGKEETGRKGVGLYLFPTLCSKLYIQVLWVRGLAGCMGCLLGVPPD